jgi:Phospholipase_D-nuclease N-terminal
MILAADYPFAEIVWTMFIFFGWVIWIWALVMIVSDVFRRDDLSGWAKAAWTMFVFFVPVLSAFIYLIAHGKEMGARRLGDLGAPRFEKPATGNGSATQIADAKRLLDQGVIDEAEFSKLKTKALA